MSNPSDTAIATPLTRTAVLAYIAAAAALKGQSERQSYYDQSGLQINDRDVYRALEQRKKPAGRKAPEDPDQREWVWDAAEVDAAKLGLDRIVAWLPRPAIPSRRGDQRHLLQALRSTPGIVRIQDCFDDSIVIEALTHDPLAKRRLQSRLQELCPDVLWTEVRQVDHQQPARGWLRITRQVAALEGRFDEPQAFPDAGKVDSD